jgi:hypothetical protein
MIPAEGIADPLPLALQHELALIKIPMARPKVLPDEIAPLQLLEARMKEKPCSTWAGVSDASLVQYKLTRMCVGRMKIRSRTIRDGRLTQTSHRPISIPI